ncbi:uncharacterized protein CIMG_08328 [Coccidioides immitis RS]|uniref:Uncharacterized protein n=4 Tax=Coccidioides immitis TaxID=5501 RepID=J3K599_COCIM|nr:uncharacterized protein CIMG_08328 [Coccidioides immitis RS]KMP06653.1 hypothetical protein CIRG_06334 [Coccidioides immitis RMSCC 2394]KMU73660.1 hypothetical protein CISG_03710 [Coccidioides immitis RMSCC 3703]KMU84232.1 hypothetical protein CIHG_02018 [Coccidioides immitis H538.4]TPX22420.1 hypothetical protein DIZ76_014292 [Coccidioides immitis]EAS29582.3 hypothetical protein CIMG_08328 [Coccidioides immitis RS]
MDPVAGAPLVIGIEALRTLDDWLETEDIVKAWYGADCNTFCELSVSRSTGEEKPRLAKVFAIDNERWPDVIRISLEKAQNWWRAHSSGQCCWLPLYRSLSEQMPGAFIKGVTDGISCIGIANSLPAARMDFWGLVVLGYANGGIPRVVRDSAMASYRATFDCRNFTLVIWQNSLNSMAVAHIIPKRHTSFDRHSLDSKKWQLLLNTGTTVIQHEDPLTRWIEQDAPKPPYELLGKDWDQNIQCTIFDYRFIKYMKDKLRQSIYYAHGAWRDVQSRYLDDLFIQNQASQISKNLLKSKVILDLETWNSFCDEMVSKEDVLHYSQRQLHQLQGEVERGNIKLNNLLQWHKNIFAFHKLLIISHQIPEELETRGMGRMVLLAGSSHGILE